MRLPWAGSLALLWAVSLSMLVIPAPAAGIYAWGHATDSDNHAPLGAVVITLRRVIDDENTGLEDITTGETQTLVNGVYVLQAPGPGQYTITASREGYRAVEREITLPTKAAGPMDFSLVRIVFLNLQLQYPAGAAPPSKPVGVQVWLWLLWGKDGATIQRCFETLGRGGVLHIASPAGVPIQQVYAGRVEAIIPGVGSASVAFTRWPDVPPLLALETGLSLTGRPLDAAGNGLTGAGITVFRALPDNTAMDWVASSKTDAAGHFSIPSLLPGRYRVVGGYPDGTSHQQVVNLGPASPEMVLKPTDPPGPGFGPMMIYGGVTPARAVVEELLPERAGTLLPISGHVLDGANGAAVSGAVVALFNPEGDLLDRGQTDLHGQFSLKSLRAGPCRIVAASDRYIPLQQNEPLTSAGFPDLNLRLARTPPLRLKLIGADGKPVTTGTFNILLRASNGEQTTLRLAPDAQGALEVPAPDRLFFDRDSVLPSVQATVWLRDPKSGCAALHLDRWPDAPVTLNVSLGVALQGQALDGAGKAAAGIPVHIDYHSANGPDLHPLTVTTDAEGNFSAEVLPAGSYVLSATLTPGEITFQRVVVGAVGVKVVLRGKVAP